MVSRAILRYARLSPRKFRLVIPLVKGRPAEESIAILSAVKKKASLYGIELLKSAIANAKRNVHGLDTSTLYISKMVADPGPMLKRFRAASMGRASAIHKHTSHLTVELDVIKTETPPQAKDKGTQNLKKAAEADKVSAKGGKRQKVKGKITTQKSKLKAAAK